MIRPAVKLFLSVCLAALLATTVRATDPATPESSAAPTAADIAKLKAKLEEQQKQVQKLQAETGSWIENAGTGRSATFTAAATADAPAPLPERKAYVGQLSASAVPVVQPALGSMTPFPSSLVPSSRNPHLAGPFAAGQ